MNPDSFTFFPTRLLSVGFLCAIGSAALLSALSPYDAEAVEYEVVSSSTFDTGAEGWKQLDVITNPQEPVWVATGGVPGGYIRSSGDLGYFLAPASFIGDKRRTYGGRIKFALRQNENTSFAPRYDVFLDNGTIRLAAFLPSNSSTAWGVFEIQLIETQWYNTAADRVATAEELISVLASLQSLQIRCDFDARSGNDNAALDNVELLARPSGPAQPELEARRVTAIVIRGEIGERYQVEYRSQLPPAEDWAPLAVVPLSQSPFTFVDLQSGATPVRFYRVVKLP